MLFSRKGSDFPKSKKCGNMARKERNKFNEGSSPYFNKNQVRLIHIFLESLVGNHLLKNWCTFIDDFLVFFPTKKDRLCFLKRWQGGV